MYFLGTTPSPSSRRPANAPGNLPEKGQYDSYSGFLFDEHSKLMYSQKKHNFEFSFTCKHEQRLFKEG